MDGTGVEVGGHLGGDWFFFFHRLGFRNQTQVIKLGMEHLDAPSPTCWLKEPSLDSTETNRLFCICRQMMKYNEGLRICVVPCVSLEQSVDTRAQVRNLTRSIRSQLFEN